MPDLRTIAYLTFQLPCPDLKRTREATMSDFPGRDRTTKALPFRRVQFLASRTREFL